MSRSSRILGGIDDKNIIPARTRDQNRTTRVQEDRVSDQTLINIETEAADNLAFLQEESLSSSQNLRHTEKSEDDTGEEDKEEEENQDILNTVYHEAEDTILKSSQEDSKESVKIELNLLENIPSEQTSVSVNPLIKEDSLKIEKSFTMSLIEKAKAYAIKPDQRIEILKEIEPNEYANFLKEVLKVENIDPTFKKSVEDKLRIIQLEIRATTPNPGAQANHYVGFRKNVPIFQGKQEEDFTQWLFSINHNIRLNNLTDEEAALAVANQLKGAPLSQFQRYITGCDNNNIKPSWISFSEMLKKTYKSPTLELNLRKKLSELKAKSFPQLSSYNDEFMKLTASIEGMTETELLHNYIIGLDSNMYERVTMERPTTLDQAMHTANTLAATSQKQANINYASKTFNTYPKKSFKKNYAPPAPGNPPTYASTRPAPAANRTGHERSSRGRQQPETSDKKSDYRHITCYNCGKAGHIKSQCRSRPKQVNMVQPSAPPEEDRHSHQQHNQPQNYHQENERGVHMVQTDKIQLTGTEILVNNIKIDAYFDTGADISIMSLQTAKEHNFKILPSKIRIKVANNAVDDAIGETESLSVVLGNSICIITFIVMQHDDHPILLGLDWFSCSRASINPSSNTITLPRQEIWLGNSNIINVENLNTVQSEADEGRLDDLMQQESFEDDFGIDPTKINEIKIKTMIEVPQELVKVWEATKLDIVDRCSTGAHDIGRFNGDEMKIKIREGEFPAAKPNYPKSKAENDELEGHVEILFQNGIIEESTSPWNNPIMMMKKKNGKKRLVNDFRATNEKAVQVIFPIILISYLLSLLSQAKFFSTCDMTSGFWQCPLEPLSRAYTAFSTLKGHWQYRVCPQGIKSGPAWFSLCVSRAMRKCQGFAINYFDDIVIYSNTIEEHLNHIKLTMLALKEYGFKISDDKSIWLATEVSLLGYIVSGSEIKINPEKIATIRDRPVPKTIKQVQQCLGLFNFYRRFIEDFAEKSKPLYNLLNKDVKFEWTKDCHSAYRYFVESITSEPAMAQPILGKPFIVYSDGSKYAIGGVLAQVIDGVEHIIEYASRLLKGAELNYGISDIECLAAVFLIRKWHNYLYGSHFTLFTDHKALIQLMGIKDYLGRLGRQAMFLQEYNFTIKYLPGEDNHAADVASRPAKFALAVTTRSAAQREEAISKEPQFKDESVDPYDDLPLLHYLKFGKHLTGLATKQASRINKIKDNFKMINDVIHTLKNEIWKEIPLKEHRKLIIEKAHLLGHFSAETTLNRIDKNYYWRNLRKDIENFILKCLTCQRNKKSVTIEHPAIAIKITFLFERIGMDIVGGLPLTSNGYNKILVIVEYMSKMIKIFPLKTKTQTEVADKLWLYISQFGPPKIIISDQGTEFVNKTIQALLDKTGIERRVTSSYNPRTDGM